MGMKSFLKFKRMHICNTNLKTRLVSASKYLYKGIRDMQVLGLLTIDYLLFSFLSSRPGICINIVLFCLFTIVLMFRRILCLIKHTRTTFVVARFNGVGIYHFVLEYHERLSKQKEKKNIG